MKKIILLNCLFILLSTLGLFSQGINVESTPNDIKFIYVGSLISDENASNNADKIRVELWGGVRAEGILSRTTYVLESRAGLKVNTEFIGGIPMSSQKIRIFEYNNKCDVVIQVSGWSIYSIRAQLLNGNTAKTTEIDCSNYDISGKKEVTDKLIQTVITASDKNGNFGIGTLSPQAKLDVRGKIIADEVEIKVNKGADFVFEADYSLPALSEVENHIKENKHLPDIPSEKEMIENGVNVNEMQIKLLQKIEELTLYVIELDKKDKEKSRLIEKQEKLIEELQNKMKD